jgi:hypothetical protein
LAWGAGESSTGPDILGIADLSSGVMEWTSTIESQDHDSFRIADLDADSGTDLILASSTGSMAGRIQVFDYATGMEKWSTQPFAGGHAWFADETIDLFQFDGDPQSEIVAATAQHYTPRIEVYDGNNGSLQAGFTLNADFYPDKLLRIRAVELNGTPYFAVGLASKIRLIDWQGNIVWSSSEVEADPVDFWAQDVDADDIEELIAVHRNGIGVYELPSVTPKQVLEMQITSANLSDWDVDGVYELLVGKDDGRIEVLNLNGFEIEDEIQFPHAIQSFQIRPEFLGFGVAVATGDGQLSIMRLDREEVAPLAQVPGWLFGEVMDVDILGRSLRIGVGSNYAVHDLLISFDDVIFSSGME